jgi:equilibrative nucleoside transporter 1/2/3
MRLDKSEINIYTCPKLILASSCSGLARCCLGMHSLLLLIIMENAFRCASYCRFLKFVTRFTRIVQYDYCFFFLQGQHVDRFITVAYLPVNLVALITVILYGKRISPRVRVQIGFLTFFLAVVCFPLVNSIHSLFQSSSILLGFLYTSVALSGVADALSQGALFGEAAALNTQYVHALVVGTSVSGVVVSVLRIITKAVFSDNINGLQISANIYFVAAALVCGICFMVYRKVLPSLVQANEVQIEVLEIESVYGSQSDETGIEMLDLDESSEATALVHTEHLVSSNAIYCDKGRDGTQGCKLEASTIAVLSRLWLPAVVMLIIYTLTLSIFPGVLAEDITPTSGGWYPVILIGIFNFADCTGKWLPSMNLFQMTNSWALLALAISRSAFVPLFYYAATYGAGLRVTGFLTGALGITNGWLTANTFVAAACLVAPAPASDVCGNIMVLSLMLGLSIGAGLSFLWLI